MAIVQTGRLNIPNVVCLSSDVSAGILPGVQPGLVAYFSDTKAWKIVKNDLSLADYVLPFGASAGTGDVTGNVTLLASTAEIGKLGAGTALIGKVGIDQTTPGTTNAVVADTELPAASALDGTIGKGLSAPVVGAALLASDGTNLVEMTGTTVDGLNAKITNGVASGTAGVPASDVITVQGISGGYTIPVTLGVGTAEVGKLAAGTALIGKVGIDQTTNGTTNAVSRAATVIAPAATASTNAYVLVPSSLLDTLYSLVATFTIRNTGADSINWKVIAGNNSGLAEAIEAQAEATVLSGAYGTFSVNPAIWRYYGVYIKSTVDNTPGQATVVGITKG